MGLYIFPGRKILSFLLILKRFYEPKVFQNHWVRQTIIYLTQFHKPCPQHPSPKLPTFREECDQNRGIQDFLGGPVVKIHACKTGAKVQSLTEELRSQHVLWQSQKKNFFFILKRQTSLVVHLLRLHAPNTVGLNSHPWRGNQIPVPLLRSNTAKYK